MASVFIYHVVGDLTLGKPELVEFDETETVESAAKVIAESSEGSVTVWKKIAREEDPRARTTRAGRFVGMLNALDLVSFLASFEDREKGMKTPVSEIVVPNEGLLKEVDPQTRLIDALDMMKQGVRRLLVRKSSQWKGMSKRFSIIYNGKWLKNIETGSSLTCKSSFSATTTTTTTNSNKFCCLSREDIVRFIICYLGTLNPIPLSSISVLGAITKDYIYTEASSSAIQSVQKLPPIDPCSIAVVETNADGSLRIIGEISACKLWKCDYLSAACALANLSAGQFVMGVNDNTSSPFSSQDCAGGNSSLKKMAAPPWPEDGGGGSMRSRKFSSKNLGYVNKPHNPNYFPENNMYRGRSAPLICKNTSSLAAVMAQMLSHRATHVWVTEADSDDVLVGIVGYTDILHAVTTNFATSSSSGSISVGGGASCITTA